MKSSRVTSDLSADSEPNGKFTHGELTEDVIPISNQTVTEAYEVESPFASVNILSDQKNGVYTYQVVEPTLPKDSALFAERARANFISSITTFPSERKKRIQSLRTSLKTFADSSENKLSDLELEKIFYNLYRELEGYGPIEVPILDDNVEDISCVGANSPIYIFHRKYGSIMSNVSFKSDEDLDNFVRLIVQRSGKHISISIPMVDCSLPNGARLQATLGREVTKNGPSFTIRRFKEDPFTPLDLIKLGTMSDDIAVYLWQAVEKGQNMFIIGGTASGKTTTLNSILSFVPSNKKLVSIEDTRELNLPLENWVQSLTRQGTGDVNPSTRKRVGEVDMFDLLVNSLRQRPDYIVIGEVRGREAYTVFQSMATGQSAISTFHSNDIPSFIHRLEGEPLNIPRSMLSSLDIVVLQSITKVGNETVRRIKRVVELVGIDKQSGEVITNNVFEWDPVSDKFIFSGHSYFHDRMMKSEDWSSEKLNDEIDRRKSLMENLRRKGQVGFSNFSKVVQRIQLETENVFQTEKENRSRG